MVGVTTTPTNYDTFLPIMLRIMLTTNITYYAASRLMNRQLSDKHHSLHISFCIFCSPADNCEQYTGSLCANLDGYSSSNVLVRKIRPLYHSQQDISDTLYHRHKTIVEIPTATPGCERIVTLLLCHSALPKCVHDSPDQPMLGCSEHCRLRDLLQRACPLQYSRYKTIVDQMNNLFISLSCSSQSSQCMRVTAESLSKLLFPNL